MPQDKDFKRLVRQRMADTGERYTEARSSLAAEGGAGRNRTTTDMAARWVSLLASVEHAPGAYELLETLPPEERRRAALSGIDHESWRVRRSCCRLLDDLELTEASAHALQTALSDPHPAVRRAALHSLSCEACKPDACALDVRPLFEQMAGDPNRRVREGVVGSLYRRYGEQWAMEMLQRFARDDPSPKLRALAEHGIAHLLQQHQSDEARRHLPDDVRCQTERHRGKWVAVVDGQVIAADRFRGEIRRAIKGTGRTDAEVYWVSPG